MISIFAPNWFTRFDIMIEIFSFLVLLAFFVLSIKSYKLDKNKKLLHLGVGFLLIAIAEVSTILTKFVLYYKTTIYHVMGNIIVKYSVLHQSDVPYDLGFFSYKLLTLLGLYIIYRLGLKNKNIGDLVIAIAFIILSALAGQIFYFIFHIILLLMLALIIKNYILVYKKNKNGNTRLLILAFSILAIGNLFLTVSTVPFGYVTGQILQLVSYFTLVVLAVRINKNEWSKRK